MKDIRNIENFHIVLWLIKDTCWLLHFKTGGIIMIIPTVLMAFYLSYHTRSNPSLLIPNLSVTCWILANGIWMMGEFFDFNHIPYSLSFFILGIILIIYYFAKYSRTTTDTDH